MSVITGGAAGSLWAWDAADDNVADRLATLVSDAGLPGTWAPDTGALLAVRGGHEVAELDVGINVVTDGVTNGTNTLTSASGLFESSMVGLSVLITGHGTRVVTAYNSATSINFSGPVIAADTGLTVKLPVGISVFDDGVTDGTNTLTSAAAPFNASHVGTTVSISDVGVREITAFNSASSVELDGAVVPAQEGRAFTLLTDIEPGDLGLETAGGQVIDSHRHPRLNVASVMRWRVGERRRAGEDRDVGAYSGSQSLGYAFAGAYSAAVTLAPDDDNESLSAPSGATGHGVFGVRGATAGNWRGLIEGASGSVRYFYCDRYSDGKLVVAFRADAGTTWDIKGASGATLATTTSAIRNQAVIFCVSADGNSLVWGPRYVRVGSSPTPNSGAFCLPLGLTVTDDVVAFHVAFSNGSAGDTSPQSPTVDVDGATTLTLPTTLDSGGTVINNRPNIFVKMAPVDGAVQDAVWNALTPSGPESEHFLQSNATGLWGASSTIGRNPLIAGGNPAINADATKAALAVQARTIFGTFRYGESSSTPIGVSYVNNNQANTYGGAQQIDLSTVTMPSDWLRIVNQNQSLGGSGQSVNRGSPAYDTDGNVYYGLNWFNNANPNPAIGLQRYPTGDLIVAVNQYEQAMVKNAADGGAVWKTPMYDSAGGLQTNHECYGVYVDEDAGEVTYLWRCLQNRVLTVDPAGAALTWSDNFLDGELTLVTLNASTGAALRAARLVLRDNEGAQFGVGGGFLYCPLNLRYDPADGELKIGVLLRLPSNPLGDSRIIHEVANGAGNGARTVIETIPDPGLGVTTAKLNVYSINPATLAVTGFERLLAANTDAINYQEPFDVRAK